LRSLRFLGTDEIVTHPEIYDRYVEALGINGAEALLASTYESEPQDSPWWASLDRVWLVKLRAPTTRWRERD
jgi:hypothetical protein